MFSSRVSPVPSADTAKASSGVVGDTSKPCCGCLGRDSIANAAARVGPAVVNLSVPQGISIGILLNYVVEMISIGICTIGAVFEFWHFVGFYGITGKSIGSGTIIDSNGTILTCAHVVVDFQGRRASSKGKVIKDTQMDLKNYNISVPYVIVAALWSFATLSDYNLN